MLTWIRHILAAPHFPDEEKTRLARLLHLMSLSAFILMAVALIYILIIRLTRPADPYPLADILRLAVSIAIAILTLQLNRRGRIRLASLLLTALALTTTGLAVYTTGGLRSLHTPLLAIPVILTSLLFGARGAGFTALLLILASAALLWLETRGLPLPIQPPAYRPVDLLTIRTTEILALALLTSLAAENIRASLARATRRQADLEQTNRQLQYIRTSLEQRLADRTRLLENRTTQFQTVAEIGKLFSAQRSLDQFLPEIASLISARFGYYHIAIYLLEPATPNSSAILAAANSLGGQAMLARGHRVKPGQPGLLGHVLAAAEMRLAPEVTRDPLYIPEPDLPDTRAQIVLPLISGQTLLGLLDIHSRAENPFNSDDIAILRLLADQIAFAIENARLIAENQAALEKSSRLYGELSAGAWQNLLRQRPELAILCSIQDSIEQVSGEWRPEQIQAAQLGQTIQASQATLAIPIKIRGHVTGVIRLRKPDDAPDWTREEIALMETLTDQLAVALESARLFQETQRRAERERLASEITARMRLSNDPQAILQTAVHELRQALQANRAQILVQPSAPVLDAPGGDTP